VGEGVASIDAPSRESTTVNASPRLIIRPCAEGDPPAIAELLARSDAEYVRYFHPFAFDAATIAAHLVRAERDQWFLLEIYEGGGFRAAGFYMLRGLDEGFADPMYGVFIAKEFSGRGLARLTLAHAEAQCRLNGWTRLLLKVDPQNARAHCLYQAAGFVFEREDPKSGHHVLCRELGA
jgi:GNAT superfamily N-acetyltransferase